MKRGNKRKGFTLIELIIVIAILGIIAAIAVPKFGNLQKDAKIRADLSTAKVISEVSATLVAQSKLTTGSYEITAENNKGTNEVKLICDQLQEFPKITSQASSTFVVIVDGDGNITVKDSSDHQMIPKPETISSANPYYSDLTVPETPKKPDDKKNE